MGKGLWFFMYDILIRCSQLFIYLGQFVNPKLKLLYRGRKTTLAVTHPLYSDVIWMHCASLGEFEQGRPCMEAIKRQFPKTKILLTFFSPSGYEIQKNYAFADVILYLPADTLDNAKFLIDKFKPKALILVKYEFWWRLIDTAIMHHIQVFSIASLFRKNQYFFSAIHRPCVELLSKFQLHFVQDTPSAEVLASHNILQCNVVGDPRVDRVIQRSLDVDIESKLTRWLQGTLGTVVYGSIWHSDIDVLAAIINALPEYKHIVAPHKIDKDNIEKLQQLLPSSTSFLYSDDRFDGNICIVNNIGKLNSMYSIANFAYIGGGFGSGIHNTLEAAVFGIPTIFGPNYTKFSEANYFIAHQMAFSVSETQQLPCIIKTLTQDNTYLKTCRQNLKQYFAQNSGATDKIMNYLASTSLLSKE